MTRYVKLWMIGDDDGIIDGYDDRATEVAKAKNWHLILFQAKQYLYDQEIKIIPTVPLKNFVREVTNMRRWYTRSSV